MDTRPALFTPTDNSLPRIESGTSTTAVRHTGGAIRSLDDLTSLLRGRGTSVEVTPISDAPVVGATATLAARPGKIEFSGWSNARVAGGVADQTFAIGLFLKSEPPNSLFNKPLTAGNVVWVRPGAGREAVYPTPIEGAFIHVPVDRLEGLLAERGFTGGDALFRQVMQVRPPDTLARLQLASVARVRSTLRPWLDGSTPIPDRAFDFAFQHLLENFMDCAALILDARYEARDVRIGDATLIKLIEDHLHDHPGEIHTNAMLCDRFGITRRTLERAFLDNLGVTPQVYLRNWRIARAHEDLVSGRSTRVTDVALHWGFFDVGRFAGYYRRMFGELPSATLKRLG